MTYLEHMKRAGEEAAKKQFGLCSTDKPPPTWAHGKKVTIGSVVERPARGDKKPCH